MQALDALVPMLDENLLPETDFIVIGMPPGHEDDTQVQQIVGRLNDGGHRVAVLCNQADRLSRQLPDAPQQNRVLAKPVTRIRLYDALLELSGQSEKRRTVRDGDPGPDLDLSVMVVDDHPGNLRLAKVFLEEMGVQVRACQSGTEAVTAFAAQHVDLVFMDIQMPDLDGIQTTRELRALEQGLRHTPIIALTAHALESERQYLLNAGMDDYLSKPVTENHLRHMLEKWTSPTGVRSGQSAEANTIEIQEHEPGIPAHAPELPVFDMTQALDRAGGRQLLAHEMHTMLLASLSHEAPRISAQAEAGSLEALLETVHKLHGATRYCGAPRLEHAARVLEEALKTDADEKVRNTAVDQLLMEIELLRSQAPDSITAKAST